MKVPNIKFHENLTTSRVVPCRQMGRDTKLTVTFRSYASSRIKEGGGRKENWKTDFTHAGTRTVGQEDEMYFETLSRSCL